MLGSARHCHSSQAAAALCNSSLSASFLALSGMKIHDHDKDVSSPSYASWSETQVEPGLKAKGRAERSFASSRVSNSLKVSSQSSLAPKAGKAGVGFVCFLCCWLGDAGQVKPQFPDL